MFWFTAAFSSSGVSGFGRVWLCGFWLWFTGADFAQCFERNEALGFDSDVLDVVQYLSGGQTRVLNDVRLTCGMVLFRAAT